MHYFIDHTKISAQTLPYGPVSGNETTQYNVTSQFSLSAPAKAFACQAASIMVIPSVTAGLVNVVLKPFGATALPLGAVKYYVYRGMKLSSFINGTGIKLETDADNSDFITRVWADYHAHKTSITVDASNPADPGNLLPKPLPASLGYSETIAGGTTIESLFNNTSIDAWPIAVQEAEWIGNFGDNAGFEIITDTDHLSLDIDYFKKAGMKLDVSSISVSTPAGLFSLRFEKEKILNYIDPAAFWGMHNSAGFDIHDPAQVTKKRKISTTDIYSTLLTPYTTKNRIYIDIRSEKGYSYNFYQNYGTAADRDKIIKINAAVEEPYHVHGWPLYFRDTLFNLSGPVNSAILNFRTDDNKKPLVYIDDTRISTRRSRPENYFADLIVTPADNWTKPVTLIFPNQTDSVSSVLVNTAYYVKLQYARQIDDTSSPTTVLKTEIGSYLDSVFMIKDLPPSDILIPVQYEAIVKKSFVNGFDFSYMASASVWHTETAALFYSETVPVANISSGEFFPPRDTSKPKETFIDHISFPKNMIINKFKIMEGSDVTGVLEMCGYSGDLNVSTPRENVHVLGITKDELSALMAAGPATPFNRKYIIFERTGGIDLRDSNSVPYRKYKLKVQVIKDDGTVSIETPASDIFVYGSSSSLLASKDFASQFTITLSLPDPAIARQWDYAGVWKTNFGSITLSVLPSEDTTLASSLTQVLKAVIYFPADRKGISSSSLDTANVSTALSTYPLVVIVHGNGHEYREYVKVLKHLALNGFIAASIDCVTDSGSKNRMLTLFRHLAHLRDGFTSKVQNNVAFMGHSRGGEAVVRAANAIATAGLTDINNITAVACLGPADQDVKPRLNLPLPLYILYGSMDGDITGGVTQLCQPGTTTSLTAAQLVALGESSAMIITGTGFDIHDRAVTRQKSMSFVRGATHNGFITTNKDLDFDAGLIRADVLDINIQKIICIGYMNSFFRMIQKSEPFWDEYFKGNKLPPSAIIDKIYQQYESPDSRIVENFQAAATDTNSADGILIDNIRTLDVHSPHETKAEKLFLSRKQTVTFAVNDNVSAFKYVSFRITKRYLSTMPDLNNLKIELSDTDSNTSALFAKDYRNIPDPHPRDFRVNARAATIRNYNTKSAMITVLIPLADFLTINPAILKNITFNFNTNAGEVEIDSIQFTN